MFSSIAFHIFQRVFITINYKHFKKNVFLGKHDSNLAPPNKEKGNVKGNVSNSQVAQGSSHDAVEKNRPDSRITDRSDEEHTTKK